VRRYLSDVEWEALCARAADEQSYVLLAEQLECSQALVRKRVSRARAQLHPAYARPELLAEQPNEDRLALGLRRVDGHGQGLARPDGHEVVVVAHRDAPHGDRDGLDVDR